MAGNATASMSENTDQSPPAKDNAEIGTAQIPAQQSTPQEHEQIRTGEAPAENSTGQGIIAATKRAYAGLTSKIKKGRGRPRNDGLAKSSDRIEENYQGDLQPNQQPLAPPTHTPPMASIPPAVDRGNLLLRKSIRVLVKGAITFFKQLIRIKADAIDLEKDFVEETLKQCDPDPEALDNFCESAELLMEKYKISTEYAPEIAFFGNGAQLFSPLILTCKRFDAEILRRRKMEGQPVPLSPKK